MWYFYGYDYKNYNDVRISCDLCNEHSVDGLKINYGTFKENEYFKLNDVRILDEAPENNVEYNL